MSLYLKIRKAILATLGWFLIIFGIYMVPRGIVEGLFIIVIGVISLYYALFKKPKR
ncbi:MAG: hypothetical protein QXX95_02200 [Nitrososphaerales archaeon]